ncbi:Ferredoxin [Capsicum annuum]|nr:Ferredoxin [Capsicum annuum]
MLETTLKLDIDLLESEELACSKSSRGLDHALFRYNVLFEDDINTLNEPNGEKDGIAYLGPTLVSYVGSSLWLVHEDQGRTSTIIQTPSQSVGLLLRLPGAGSCSSCTGTVDQSDGNYLDDDQIADEFVQLCSPVLFTHSLMLPLRSTRRSSVAKFNIYSPTYIK